MTKFRSVHSITIKADDASALLSKLQKSYDVLGTLDNIDYTTAYMIAIDYM